MRKKSTASRKQRSRNSCPFHQALNRFEFFIPAAFKFSNSKKSEKLWTKIANVLEGSNASRIDGVAALFYALDRAIRSMEADLIEESAKEKA
jgi:hypothetical protein